MSVNLKTAAVAVVGVIVGTFSMTLDCAASDSIAKAPSENTGLRVALMRFEEHTPSSADGSFLTGLIPGVVYSKWHEITGFTVYHSKCLKERLDHSNAFAVINEEEWSGLQKKHHEYDLLVTGTVEYDKTAIYRLSYGLSVLAFYLRFLGAPEEWTERHLLMDISVRPPSEPYRVLYQKKLEMHGSKQFTNGLWYGASFQETLNNLKNCTQEENEAIDEILKGVRAGGPIAQALAERKTKENH